MKQKTKTYFIELVKADPLLRKDYEISEEELRNCVKKTLLEIKDRYP